MEQIPPQQFELFKDNVKHAVRRQGQLGFIEDILTSDEITDLWKNGMDLYALYLLAMTDHLSKLNGIPLYEGYDELRRYKMKKKIYPVSIMLRSEISGKGLDELTEDAIPEFLEYNIVEGDIFNVV